MTSLAIVAVTVVVLILPGTLVARSLRLGWTAALASSIPLTCAISGLCAPLFGWLRINWNPLTAMIATVILAALGAALARLLSWPHTRFTIQWRRLTPAIGVLAGAALIGITASYRLVRGVEHGVDSIPQGWDALWHVNVIKFIADSGVSSPLRMGELINTDNHARHFYPSAWHALMAIVEDLTGASALRVYNLGSVTTLALLVPIGVAVLTWWLWRSRSSRAAWASACAAAVVGLLPATPYLEIGVSAIPSAVAAPMGLAVAGLFFAHVYLGRGYGIAAAAALAGVTAVHPSGAWVTALVVACWWLARLIRPVRSRARDFWRFAWPVVVAGLLSLPQVAGVLGGDEEVTDFRFFEPGDRWNKALTMTTRHLDLLGPQTVLLVIAGIGLLMLLLWRRWWLVLAWGALVVLCANSVRELPGGTRLYTITEVFYNDPRRLTYVIALLVAVAIGTAIGVAAHSIARTRVLAAMVIVVLAVALAGGVKHQHRPSAELATMDRMGRMISDDDRVAMSWLADQPGARDTTILNNVDQGTGWMYALTGLHPMFTHYRVPGFSTDQLTVYWHVNLAGISGYVDAALHRLNVRYVYDSPPVYWPFEPTPGPLAALDNTPGLQLVYRHGEVRIYEVKAATL